MKDIINEALKRAFQDAVAQAYGELVVNLLDGKTDAQGVALFDKELEPASRAYALALRDN